MGDRLQEHQRTLHPVHAGDSEIGTGQARKRWQWSTHSLSAELQRNTRTFWRRLKIHVPGCVGHCGANGRYLTSQACVNSRAGGALPPKTIAGAPLCAVPRQRGDHCGFQFDLYGSRRIFPTRLKNARRFNFVFFSRGRKTPGVFRPRDDENLGWEVHLGGVPGSLCQVGWHSRHIYSCIFLFLL